MILSDLAVRKPVAISALIIGLMLLGLNAWRQMPLEAMPAMDIPYITVVTVYPGASPEEIEVDIARRIEDAVGSLDGLKHITSTCMDNVCQTLLEFRLGYDVDILATDVQLQLDLIQADLPQEAESPKIIKVDINATPIVTLALSGTAPLDELYDYADEILSSRLSTVPGVARVELIGGAEREVHVDCDRDALTAHGLTVTGVMQTINRNIRSLPIGRIREDKREVSLTFDARFSSVEDIGLLPIAADGGAQVFLRDVATVSLTSDEVRQRSYFDGQPCITIRIVKKGPANALDVVDAVSQRMTDLKKSLPGGMTIQQFSHDGTYIRALNSDAWLNVAAGVALTGLILLFFLYNLRSLLVIAVSMPLTIVIGMFFMRSMGFSLNMMTLMSIGMSVGILVTNTIVVLESIITQLKKNGDPKESARIGAHTAVIAILASAATNLVVLVPMATMDNMIGIFISSFSMTMIIMTLSSLFVSFTLTPMLCAYVMRSSDAENRGLLGWAEKHFNRFLGAIINAYLRLLRLTKRSRFVCLAIIAAVLLLFWHSGQASAHIGDGFLPETDKGEIIVKLEYPSHYRMDVTKERVHQLEKKLQQDAVLAKEIRHSLVTIGKVEGIIGQNSEGVHLGQIQFKLSERTERRQLPLTDIRARINTVLADESGVISTAIFPSLIGGASYQVEYEIAGEDLNVLDSLALTSQRHALAQDGFVAPDTTVRARKPELRLRPKRRVLADNSIAALDLAVNARASIEGLDAALYTDGTRNLDIVVSLNRQDGLDQISDLSVPGPDGTTVSLDSLVTIEQKLAPTQIIRKDKQRISKLLANLETSLPLTTAMEYLDEKMLGTLPLGYTITKGGPYELMAEGQAGLAEAGLVSIVLIVLCLAAILGSYKQVGLMLVTLPLAFIGMNYSIALCGEMRSIYVTMGGVMLIGIVVNNAILIMDQFNIHVSEGLPRHEAMITAAGERFRAVIMITLAAMLGMLPLAISQGIGAESRVAVGWASMGGILSSGFLTLLVLPVLYNLFTKHDG